MGSVTGEGAIMKLFLASAAVIALAAAGARAADLPAQPAYEAPPIAAPVPYSWTGFYIGLNAGGAWGRDDISSVDFSPRALAVDLAATSAATSPRLRPNGFTSGGQVGYNWQTGNIVFGLEADFNYMGLRASQGGTLPFPSAPTLFFTANTSVSTNWLFTTRPRIGWAANNVLIYVTGGLAVTDERFNQTLVLLPPFVVTSTASTTRAGWTVGGGVEWALNQNWSVKGEYLYSGFGTLTTSGVIVPAFAGSSFNNSAHLTTSIARFGINYKFGSPAVARY
jgi:outer membrane immunogenic protein